MEQQQERKIKTLQKDLELLENYAEELFAFIPIPIVFTNPNGAIIEANSAFTEFIKKEKYRIVGSSIVKITNQEVFKLTQEALETKKTLEKEVLIKTEKEKVPTRISVRSRTSTEGNKIGCFLGFFNMEKIKKKEKELKKRNKKLKKMNKIMVGRENRMIELKEKIKMLKNKLEESGD